MTAFALLADLARKGAYLAGSGHGAPEGGTGEAVGEQSGSHCNL